MTADPSVMSGFHGRAWSWISIGVLALDCLAYAMLPLVGALSVMSVSRLGPVVRRLDGKHEDAGSSPHFDSPFSSKNCDL